MLGSRRSSTESDTTGRSGGELRVYPRGRTEEEWRETLTDEEFRVLRRAGTERAFTGEYTDNHDVGVYSCRACGTELFRSEQKFDSHCGWPSFFSPLAGDRIEEIRDTTMGMVRTEVRCAACGSHLGHVFEGEGYDTPTDLRYCINSVSMRFEPA
ncbi:peptide-methionine (R)-S-oxide reductase MsrB [Aquipuribacter sp. SD81]|uniref:peptide-methionine (R)-S-oxide reductase MsrB n=1 Tax=Aquipuribacter sp. SD81 TaxID=3127703 RepID=UPI003017F86D